MALAVTNSRSRSTVLGLKKSGISKADVLAKQEPPVGCTPEQWMEYVEDVRNNEEMGYPNPEFMVRKPWIKSGCQRPGSFYH